jgi:hypothetical protein
MSRKPKQRKVPIGERFSATIFPLVKREIDEINVVPIMYKYDTEEHEELTPLQRVEMSKATYVIYSSSPSLPKNGDKIQLQNVKGRRKVKKYIPDRRTSNSYVIASTSSEDEYLAKWILIE